MKPNIHKSGLVWICRGNAYYKFVSTELLGIGQNPKQSYDDYQAQYKKWINSMGKEVFTFDYGLPTWHGASVNRCGLCLEYHIETYCPKMLDNLTWR